MIDDGGLDGLSIRSMADLARGAGAIAEQPGTQINFRVHHEADRPGYIQSQLNQGKALARYNEVLICNLNGVVVVAGSDRGPLGADMRKRHRGSSTPVRAKVRTTSTGQRFVGASMPNPSFIYESAARFEVLIALDMKERMLRQMDARAILHTLAEVAHCAAHLGHAPIMSLQCPVQLPPERTIRPRVEDQDDSWGGPSAMAVRVVFALQKPTSQLREEMAQRLASFCAERGYGLWLGDLRQGHAQGNWFKVLEHNKPKCRKYRKLHSFHDGDLEQVKRVFPVTLVGPARVGSTNAVLGLLRAAARLGVVGCAITSLDDLAFVHLQLTTPWMNDVKIADAVWNPDKNGVSEQLSKVVEGLNQTLLAADSPDQQPDDRAPRVRLIERAGDYQVFAGPVFDIKDRAQTGRLPLWFSWRQSGTKANWRPAFEALQAALKDCELWYDHPTPDLQRCANFEYMLCRAIGGGAYTAKGKLTIPGKLLLDRTTALEYSATKLCVRVEAAWRARLAKKEVPGLDSISFAWREYYLGNSRTR